MSFSFGFSGNDYDDDVQQQNQDLAPSATNSALVNPLDDPRLLTDPVIQPKIEDLSVCLQTLNNVRLTFEQFFTPETNTPLFRRELFDIKHQLMMNDQDSDEIKNELDIITNEDLKKNVYEGGLKSWECSIDLVDSFTSNNILNLDFQNTKYVIELGCGTALPSEYIFAQYIQSGLTSGIHFILTDYNISVLKLASLPNLIITWAKLTLSEEEWTSLQRCHNENIPVVGDELLLTDSLLDTFYNDMQRRNIKIDLISGSWGRQFNNLLYSLTGNNVSGHVLTITSETIYQPENLPLISETLIDLRNTFASESHILVAAKDIYFGVGGSILDFQNYLTAKNIPFNTFKVNAGLKRSIVYIK